MLKPKFSLWGYLVGGHVRGPWASCDVPNTVPHQLGAAFGIGVESADEFVSEGGDKSFNGLGTVLMSRAVERQRHPGKSIDWIEATAHRRLRTRHVVWTGAGVADDEQSFRGPLVGEGGRKVYTTIGTGGHVDECARFIGPSSVVVPQLSQEQAARSPIAATTAQRLDANAAMLANQTDQDGTRLTVARMPYPEELYATVNASDGVYQLLAQLPEIAPLPPTIEVVLASSYTNYVLANGLLLLPQYYKPGRARRFAEADKKAVETMQRLFPGYTVVGVNPEAVNAGGGGLNCISNNMPAA